MNDTISNVISFLALVFSIISYHVSRRTETNLTKSTMLSSLEQKLDFIIANYKEEHLILYKTSAYQDDLKQYCQQYKINLEYALKLYAKIYIPITNDGEDVPFSINEIQLSAADLLKYLKNQ